MAAKKAGVGIRFMHETKKKGERSPLSRSGYGGGTDLAFFGGKKPRVTAVSGAFLGMEINHSSAKKEFFQFAGDLWIAIVRNSVWSPLATGPSPTDMIYTRANSDGMDFGWRNYPSASDARKKWMESKGREYTGTENVEKRFKLRADIFADIVLKSGKKFFGALSEGKAIRDKIASDRVRYAISEAQKMSAPGGEQMKFQVPIRSGKRAGEYQEKLHPNARKAEISHARKVNAKAGRMVRPIPEDGY